MFKAISEISRKKLDFCYPFRSFATGASLAVLLSQAIQMGDVSKVVPIDKVEVL